MAYTCARCGAVFLSDPKPEWLALKYPDTKDEEKHYLCGWCNESLTRFMMGWPDIKDISLYEFNEICRNERVGSYREKGRQ